jgi:polyhydroxyalkanoate synthesis regulator protein
VITENEKKNQQQLVNLKKLYSDVDFLKKQFSFFMKTFSNRLSRIEKQQEQLRGQINGATNIKSK